MKKLLALLLAMVMAASLMTACEKKPQGGTSPDGIIQEDGDYDGFFDFDKDHPPKTTPSGVVDTQPEETTGPAFQSVTVADSQVCTLILEDIHPEDPWGYGVDVYIRNKTGVKAAVSVEDARVNGLSCDPGFTASLEPGEESRATIYFPGAFPEDIGPYTEIFMKIVVRDAQDRDAEPLTVEQAHIYPQGQENATAYIRQPRQNDLVILDDEFCSIRVIGTREDEIRGYTLITYIQNKSETTAYTVGVEQAAVNGIASDPGFRQTLLPGCHGYGEICFTQRLPIAMEEYTDIALAFTVTPAEDRTAEPVSRVEGHIYPQGKEEAALYIRPAQSDDLVLVEDDRMQVVITGCRRDEVWGYVVDVFIQNRTDRELTFTLEDGSVNGLQANPHFYGVVPGNVCAFGSFYWSNSTLEGLGISQVETVYAVLRCYDAEKWLEDDLVRQSFTLNPE